MSLVTTINIISIVIQSGALGFILACYLNVREIRRSEKKSIGSEKKV